MSQPQDNPPERILSKAATFILSRALETVTNAMDNNPSEDVDGNLSNDYARIYGLLQRGSGDAHHLIDHWDVIRKATKEYEALSNSNNQQPDS